MLSLLGALGSLSGQHHKLRGVAKKKKKTVGAHFADQSIDIDWLGMVFGSLADSIFKKIYLFGLSCSPWDLQSLSRHVGSSSLTRGCTCAPCIGSTVS